MSTTPKTLYIIGNGFDLYHGVASSYNNFKEFLLKSSPEIFDLANTFLDKGLLWSNFEAALASLNGSKLKGDSDFLIDYTADSLEWHNAARHRRDSILEKIKDLSDGLRSQLAKWICNLEVPRERLLRFDDDAIFLNFNYTLTLEETYEISPDVICHIHNSVANSSSILIGHGARLREKTTGEFLGGLINDGSYREFDDIDEGIDNYFRRTYKNTSEIINANADFFNRIFSVQNVFVLGHSMSDVDWAYFKKTRHETAQDALWVVTYYSENDRKPFYRSLRDLNVEPEKIIVIPIDQFAAITRSL
jgi:hypothetical protein